MAEARERLRDHPRARQDSPGDEIPVPVPGTLEQTIKGTPLGAAGPFIAGGLGNPESLSAPLTTQAQMVGCPNLPELEIFTAR